jgi:YbbR domain-containing protein
LFHIRADEVRAPFGVEVAQVIPSTLALDLEKSAHRTVPVVAATEGDPAPGYVVGRIRSEPATVEIVGPETRVRQVAEATTEPVPIKDAKAQVRDAVAIGVVDTSVRLAQPQNAQVTVEIGPAPVEQQIDAVPVRYRNVAQGLSAQLSPKFVRVTVRGEQRTLAQLEPDSVEAYLDLAGLGAGRYNLRVQVAPAERFGVVAIEPAVLTVTVK